MFIPALCGKNSFICTQKNSNRRPRLAQRFNGLGNPRGMEGGRRLTSSNTNKARQIE
jgi:hypothetical protein